MTLKVYLISNLFLKMFPETFLLIFGFVRDVQLDLFVPALELKVQDRVLDLGQVILHLIVPDLLLKTGMGSFINDVTQSGAGI